MHEELKQHIKKLQIRSICSCVALLLTIISIGFGGLFLFVPSFAAAVFFGIAGICIFYLIYIEDIAKKETVHTPVRFNLQRNLSFDELVASFENLTEPNNRLSASEDVRFFRFRKIFRLRAVLYRTAAFDKKEFDRVKDRINKKANKELKISSWVDRTEAANMMRFNVIYTDTLNDALYTFLSQNASRNLQRVEGIIQIAIVDNQIIIPPLYGAYNLIEINRYKKTIQFINQILLK